jgi:hypothetical protein
MATCALVGPPDACNPNQIGGTFCCGAVEDAGACRDISASNYEQSCSTDEDCTMIGEGNSCSLCGFIPAGISVHALAKYLADVAGTTAYLTGGRFASERSGGAGKPCCIAGTCQVGFCSDGSVAH